MPRRLTIVLTLLGGLAACSSDGTGGDGPTAAPTTVVHDIERPTHQLKLRAQESLGRSFGGGDYECEEPTSAEPGTTFSCHWELDGRDQTFTATINADGTVSLAMDDTPAD